MELPEESMLGTGYRPTVLSWEEANEAFNMLVPGPYEGPGRCADRAYLWSYEMDRFRQIQSMTVFLFFSEKFRSTFTFTHPSSFFKNKKRFPWWFHAAPMVYVGKEKTEAVLDRQFFKRPMPLREWAEAFLSVDPALKQLDYELTTNASHPRLTFDSAHCTPLKDVNDVFKKSAPFEWCAMRIVPMYLSLSDVNDLDKLMSTMCPEPPTQDFNMDLLEKILKEFYPTGHKQP